MPTMEPIALLVLVESAIIVVAAHLNIPLALQATGVALNMLIIMLIAPAMMSIPGFGTTNIGTILYAAAVAAQCVLIERYGFETARQTVIVVNIMMVCKFVLFVCIDQFPGTSSNDNDVIVAIEFLVSNVAHFAVAAFVSFFLSQAIMMRAWSYLRPTHGMLSTALLSMMVCQAVDTPLFFAIAFWDGLKFSALTEAASVGFIVKSLLAAAFLPAIWLATRPRPF